MFNYHQFGQSTVQVLIALNYPEYESILNNLLNGGANEVGVVCALLGNIGGEEFNEEIQSSYLKTLEIIKGTKVA